MKSVRPYGTLIALALALAAVTATTVSIVNHGAQQGACSLLTPAAGGVIVTSVVVLLIAGRALTRQARREIEHANGVIEHRECPHCKRVVHGAWRMCPYCGELVDEALPRNEGEVPA